MKCYDCDKYINIGNEADAEKLFKGIENPVILCTLCVSKRFDVTEKEWNDSVKFLDEEEDKLK